MLTLNVAYQLGAQAPISDILKNMDAVPDAVNPWSQEEFVAWFKTTGMCSLPEIDSSDIDI